MFAFRKRIINLFLNKKYQPVTIVAAEIPFHVKEVAKLYPILHTVAANRAVGEVMKFYFEPGKENKLRIGQAFLITEKGITSTWIHVGHDFFKLVMKA